MLFKKKEIVTGLCMILFLMGCVASTLQKKTISENLYIDPNIPSIKIKFPFKIYLKSEEVNRQSIGVDARIKKTVLSTERLNTFVVIEKIKITQANGVFTGKNFENEKLYYKDKRRSNSGCFVFYKKRKKKSYLIGTIIKYRGQKEANYITISKYFDDVYHYSDITRNHKNDLDTMIDDVKYIGKQIFESSKLQSKPVVEDIESKLIKFKNLKDRGLITQEDYDKSKDKLLNKYSLKSAIHSDVRVLPVSSGVPNLMQSSKTYPVNGTWKISGIEQDGKYVEAKFKDEGFFIFNENSFDLMADGEFLSDAFKLIGEFDLGKISYNVKNGKITLSTSAGEKLTANIEFITPTSLRVSNFEATQMATTITMSVKAALTGKFLPKPIGLPKNTVIYFSKIQK